MLNYFEYLSIVLKMFINFYGKHFRFQNWWKAVSYVQPTQYIPQDSGETNFLIMIMNIIFRMSWFWTSWIWWKVNNMLSGLSLAIYLTLLSCLLHFKWIFLLRGIHLLIIISSFCQLQRWRRCHHQLSSPQAIKGGKVEGVFDFFARRHRLWWTFCPRSQRSWRCHSKGVFICNSIYIYL